MSVFATYRPFSILHRDYWQYPVFILIFISRICTQLRGELSAPISNDQIKLLQLFAGYDDILLHTCIYIRILLDYQTAKPTIPSKKTYQILFKLNKLTSFQLALLRVQYDHQLSPTQKNQPLTLHEIE